MTPTELTRPDEVLTGHSSLRKDRRSPGPLTEVAGSIEFQFLDTAEIDIG